VIGVQKARLIKSDWWALATESRCRSWTACSVVAIADGGYPEVFNHATVDSSFGIISPIFLLELTESGEALGRLPVPTNLMTTSFSSKSELGLHLIQADLALTFMGYVAPVNTLDVSNSNTPGHFDSSNPVPSRGPNSFAAARVKWSTGALLPA
jgi:hypothetical protein